MIDLFWEVKLFNKFFNKWEVFNVILMYRMFLEVEVFN